MTEAIIAKMFNFIGKYSELDKIELQYYLLQHLSKTAATGGTNNGDALSQIMSQMQSLLDLPGQKEKQQGSQLRQIQGNKAGPRRGLRGAGARAKPRTSAD
jgi:hypothetical protein